MQNWTPESLRLLPRELKIEKLKRLERGKGGIESDWRTWLHAVFPDDFEHPHAWFHEALWDWFWKALDSKVNGEPLPEGNALFDIIFRGGGKSHHCRRAPLAEAARLKRGYCLYVSATQDLANAHLAEIASIIEDSEIGTYYPDLARVQRSKVSNQSKGWTQSILRTERGYVIQAIGLDVGIRGANKSKMRPSLIVLDDIDELDESPEVTQKHLQKLLSSVLPTRTAGTLILSAQNLIHEGSIINQIYEGEVRALIDRKVIGPVPAVEGLETDTYLRPDGQIEDRIVAGTPTWPEGFPLSRAQEEINFITLESFEAELQHDLSAKRAGRIMHMFDEDVHLITLSQFKSKFKHEPFPAHWQQWHTHDAGYTGEGAHPGVFFFLGVSSADSVMPGTLFIAPEIYLGEKNGAPGYSAERYLARVLQHKDWQEIDMVSRWSDEKKNRAMKAYERYLSDRPNLLCRMSHEQLATRRVFREYGINFVACNPGADGGIQQLQHFHGVDYNAPHPFKEGVLGASQIYWIIADDQIEKARDEYGMIRGRVEAKKWVWRKVKDTETGLTKQVPRKAYDDWMNAAMMAFHDLPFQIVPLTEDQQTERDLPKGLRRENITKLDPQARDFAALQRDWEISQLKEKREKTLGNWASEIVSSEDDAWVQVRKMQGRL